MDPTGFLFGPGVYGLPRTRGDGPELISAETGECVAPPHARGWTGTPLRFRGRDGGSPARAGMDPEHGLLLHSAHGLPRTRGDGPSRQLRPDRYCPAPPHARGWTVDEAFPICLCPGSPARAGMDRQPAIHRCVQGRLPRTRGDGPLTSCVGDSPVRAPPHARGWTPWCRQSGPWWWGSPARAGMDPIEPVKVPMNTRLPRTRGDGPHLRSDPSPCHAAPPHARGWTR